MADYESKKKRMQADLDRANELRQSLRESGDQRDQSIDNLLKKRITLPSVAIQRIIDEVKVEGDEAVKEITGYNRTYSRHNR